MKTNMLKWLVILILTILITTLPQKVFANGFWIFPGLNNQGPTEKVDVILSNINSGDANDFCRNKLGEASYGEIDGAHDLVVCKGYYSDNKNGHSVGKPIDEGFPLNKLCSFKHSDHLHVWVGDGARTCRTHEVHLKPNG